MKSEVELQVLRRMRAVSPNTVLLVDDDPSVRNFLSMSLEQAGFEVRQANDGIDGLVKLREQLPRIIISDLQMPRMSGFEFIGVVHRRFPSIPVIAFSGSIPGRLPADTNCKPSRWFEKSMQRFPDLLQAVNELVRSTPDRVDSPHVISTPVRARRDFADSVMLTCTECLRTFRATSTHGNNAVEETGVCTFCEARVPFLIEGSALA